MKTKSVLLIVLLLLMSIVLGWFLPYGTVAFLDKNTESKAKTVKIEPINLSYSQNLTIADKIQAISRFMGGETLQSGIFLKKDEAEQIAKQFFADFWEQLTVEDINPHATPQWVKDRQENVLVVWLVTVDSPPFGSGTVVIDDATGVILAFNLYSGTIVLLEPEQSILKESSTALLNHFLSAYHQHLQAQNAALTCQCIAEDSEMIDQYYSLSLTSPDGNAVSSSLRIYYSTGEIMFNIASEHEMSMP